MADNQTKFVNIQIDGWIWLAVRINGRTLLLYKSGRVGDCIRPGQRAQS